MAREPEYAPTPGRIDQLSFTRFLFALIIVPAHFGEDLWPFWNQKVWWVVQQAYFGPSYFFVLSGFVMIVAYGSKPRLSALDYYKNRVARIYPVYLFALLMTVAMTAAAGTIIWGDLLMNLLAVQAWVPGKALSMNFPAWSLSVEFALYAIFPLLFNRIFTKRNWKSLVVPALIIWLVTQVVFKTYTMSGFNPAPPGPAHDLGWFFPVMHLNAFLIGNVAGLAYMHSFRGRERNLDKQILAGLILLFLACRFKMGLNYHDGLLSPLLAVLIVLLALNTGTFTRVLKLPPLVFLGEISYGVYILQAPIVLYFREVYRNLRVTDGSWRYWLSFLTLVAIASASYVWLETPLRNRIKNLRLPGSRSPATPVAG